MGGLQDSCGLVPSKSKQIDTKLKLLLLSQVANSPLPYLSVDTIQNNTTVQADSKKAYQGIKFLVGLGNK